MTLIQFPGMSLLMVVISDIIFLIFPSIGVKYHIECDMAVPRYLPLATNDPDSIPINGFIFLKGLW